MIVPEGGRLRAGERDAPGQQRLVVLEARGFGQGGEQAAPSATRTPSGAV